MQNLGLDRNLSFLKIMLAILAHLHFLLYLCTRFLRWREYVLRKAFRKGSFLGRFRTYLNSVYCALRLINRKLRNFSNQIKTKVTVNAYGYDYIHTMLVSRHSVLSYQRRFPVVLFDLVGNAKASVNK